MVLFLNPLTTRVKPWVIRNFLTSNSMDRTLSQSLHNKNTENDYDNKDFEAIGIIIVIKTGIFYLMFY